MGKVSESIYSGKDAIIPLADVQHIEPWPGNSVPGIRVITRHTRWDAERDDWANCIWISEPEATAFKAAWCRYRSELEAETLADLSTPTVYLRDVGSPEDACWVPCAKGDPGATAFAAH